MELESREMWRDKMAGENEGQKKKIKKQRRKRRRPAGFPVWEILYKVRHGLGTEVQVSSPQDLRRTKEGVTIVPDF